MSSTHYAKNNWKFLKRKSQSTPKPVLYVNALKSLQLFKLIISLFVFSQFVHPVFLISLFFFFSRYVKLRNHLFIFVRNFVGICKCFVIKTWFGKNMEKIFQNPLFTS